MSATTIAESAARFREIASRDERTALRVPKRLSVSEWADRYRVLGGSSPEPGPWRTARAPYLAGIMDSFSDSTCSEIVFMKPSQIGGTEAIYNAIGYAIDRDPGSMIIMMPRKEDVRRISQNRLQKVITESPRLRRYLPSSPDDFNIFEYRLRSMSIRLAGSNSPADLSETPCRYVLIDETDKCPRWSGREASPINLVVERAKNFYDRKIIKTSTPTTRAGVIFQSWEQSDQRRYHVPCPFCEEYQPLGFMGGLRWSKGASPEDLEAGRARVWYECRACKRSMSERHKTEMLQRGRWIAERPESRIRGFQISSLYSPWVRWFEVASEFLRSKDFPERMMNFVNSWLGEVWEERETETTADHVRACAESYAQGIVPSAVRFLFAGIDVQSDYLVGVIRGWAPGESSYLVRAFRCQSFDELQHIVFGTQYATAQDPAETMRVVLAAVDSGHRTDEVYRWVRRNAERAIAVKGAPARMRLEKPLRESSIDRDPKTKRRLAKAVRLAHVDTIYFKDKLARMIHSGPGDPSRFYVHEDPPEWYLEQVAAEHCVIDRDRKTGEVRRYWVPRSSSVANHALDCEVYAAAAEQFTFGAGIPADAGERVTYQPKRREENTLESLDRDFMERETGRRDEDGAWVKPRRRRRGWLA